MCLYFFLAQITSIIMKHYPPKKGIMMNETQNETFYTQEEMETVTQSAYRALVWIGVGIWAVAVTFVALIITVIAK